MKKNLYTVISKDSIFKGEFVLKNSIRIEGNFEGDIQTKEDAIITKTGVVKSDIKANRVIVDGNLVGNISASSSVVISSTGSVKGDIKSPNLKVEDGSITYGKITINENKVNGK